MGWAVGLPRLRLLFPSLGADLTREGSDIDWLGER